MLPKFAGLTGNLPPGQHPVSWADLVLELGFSPRRQSLLRGLLAACRALRTAGVTHLYIAGSFATNKRNPRDYDACYSILGVDGAKLDPVLRDFSNQRAAMKAKYKGELFPAEWPATALGPPYLDFFQKDKNGRRRGIILLDLGTLP